MGKGRLLYHRHALPPEVRRQTSFYQWRGYGTDLRCLSDRIVGRRLPLYRNVEVARHQLGVDLLQYRICLSDRIVGGRLPLYRNVEVAQDVRGLPCLGLRRGSFPRLGPRRRSPSHVVAQDVGGLPRLGRRRGGLQRVL